MFLKPHQVSHECIQFLVENAEYPVRLVVFSRTVGFLGIHQPVTDGYGVDPPLLGQVDLVNHAGKFLRCLAVAFLQSLEHERNPFRQPPRFRDIVFLHSQSGPFQYGEDVPDMDAFPFQPARLIYERFEVVLELFHVIEIDELPTQFTGLLEENLRISSLPLPQHLLVPLFDVLHLSLPRPELFHEQFYLREVLLHVIHGGILCLFPGHFEIYLVQLVLYVFSILEG